METKIFMRVVIIYGVVFLLMMIFPILAKSYYVDKNHSSASDSNTGTQALPWITIQHAAETIVAGDTVFIRKGIYHEQVFTENDGDATAPAPGNWETIRFQATSDDGYNLIDHCRILYGGYYQWGALTYTDAGGEVSNSLLSDASYFGIKCEGTASPVCTTSVEIRNCTTTSNFLARPLPPLAESSRMGNQRQFEALQPLVHPR